jgi:hypothetical protein
LQNLIEQACIDGRIESQRKGADFVYSLACDFGGQKEDNLGSLFVVLTVLKELADKWQIAQARNLVHILGIVFLNETANCNCLAILDSNGRIRISTGNLGKGATTRDS